MYYLTLKTIAYETHGGEGPPLQKKLKTVGRAGRKADLLTCNTIFL